MHLGEASIQSELGVRGSREVHAPSGQPARPDEEVAMQRIRKYGQPVRETIRSGSPEWSQAVTVMFAEHRRRIQGELITIFGRLRENGHPENGDDIDRAAFGYDQELGSARVNQLNQMLRQIEHAAARHAQSRYGRCGHCNEGIPLARLRSLPFALFCRECQETKERRERLLGRSFAY